MFTLLVVFFLIAILTSFMCSLWEAVLLSITPSYAQVKVEEGGALGKTLQSFKENIDHPLAAILTLNTIAHTVGAIGVGDQAAKIWSDANPLITSFLVPAAMTLAILVLSELIPKTLGANYWRELAPFTARSLRLLITLLMPLVWFSQFITKSMKKDKSESVLSRSDFLALADLGTKQGVFEQHESEFITNLLRFGSIQAQDIMTPRTVVKAAPADISVRDFFDQNPQLRFSRIPIYEKDTMDQIIGYFLKDEMLEYLVNQDGSEAVKKLRRDIVVIKENFPITELFNRFLQKREHIALVVDQFGGTRGIVTMEDVIETLLGLEITDEYDQTIDMQVLARKKWEQRARKLGLLEVESVDAQN